MIKKEDMLKISEEPKLSTPVVSQTPTGSGTNTEPILRDNSEVSYTSPMVDAELAAIQVLKNSQLSLVDSPAAQHITGMKTRVIYFNQVTPKANNDVISISSPGDTNHTKYNRVENLIITTNSELSLSFAQSEGDVSSATTASAVIYPGTVRPYPNDLFYSYEQTRGVLYRVTSVTPIYNTPETGFNIEFEKHYDQFDPDQLTNLVEGYYVFNFETLGTGGNTILERSMYDIYRVIDKSFKEISEEYTNRFFDKQKNTIYYHHVYSKTPTEFISMGEPPDTLVSSSSVQDRDIKILDPYVITFFAKAFENQKLISKNYSIYPITPIWIDKEFDDIYKFTIFNAIKCRDIRYLKYYYQLPVRFQKRTLRDITYDGWYYFEPIGMFGERCIDIYPPSFITRIIENTLYTITYDKPEHLKYNTIIRFMNIPDYIPTVQEIETYMRDIAFMPDSEFYGTAPLILYMMNYTKNLITKKTY